jgi:mannitol operon repressor
VRPEEVKGFSEFLQEFQKETDRGAALVGAALLDSRLRWLLVQHFIESGVTEELLDGGNAPLGAFRSKIKLTHALGLITGLEFQEAQLIRKVRNEFAHQLHGLSFDSAYIASLCSNLKANTPGGDGGSPRWLFINSVIHLTLALWHRPEHVAGRKAVFYEGPWQLAPEQKHS